MSKQIPLTQSKFAIVDNEDYEWLMQWKWCAAKVRNTFYATRVIGTRLNQQTISMHRLIMNTAKEMQTDHRNHNGLDNRKENIRTCTHSENQHNRKVTHKGTSKYKGVCWKKGITYKGHQYDGKWCTQITNKDKSIHIGYFNDEIKAAKAYDQKAKELFGEFAHTNF